MPGRMGMLGAVVAVAVALGASTAGAAPVSFSAPQYVDPGLAGGEPEVLADTMHGTLLYTSHEGTTHLYRPGLVTTQPNFETHYRDQVNMWTSKDNGATWQFVNYNGTGFSQNPSQNAGFSDPDLTQDQGGRDYNTGIDLANDAIFSSADGGLSWDRGTPQCHDGDRPWMAGGKKDEVFMSTDTQEGNGHQVFQSTDGGNTCSATGIPANGTMPNGDTWTGDGKLFYVPSLDHVVEPMITRDANGNVNGVGVDSWRRGSPAFRPWAVIPTTLQAHWPSIALDRAGNLYVTWDTDARDKNNKTGCSDQSPTGNGASGAALPNQIMLAVSHDLGKTWSATRVIAAPANTRVLWPWVIAGDAGKVSVVWYQLSKLADPDCAGSDVSTYIYDANITGADNLATAQITPVNAAARSIHEGGICQGGTTCVATGQDRRLGDFFTNALDARGCVMIASGDTERDDPITHTPLPTSLPIILRQNSGPPLVGAGDCSKGLPNVPAGAFAVNVGGAGVAGHARCPDHTAPRSRFSRASVHATRHHLRLSGTSRDTDFTCATPRARVAGVVAQVRVAVGREVHRARKCRFLKADGSFGAPRSCHRTSYLPARGTAHWHFDFATSFPRGRYKLWARGIDPAGNIERKHVPRNFRRIRIP